MHSLLLETYTEVLDNNNSTRDYFLARIPELESSPKKIDLFDNGILSEGKVTNWGFYKILNVKTIFKKDTIQQQSLLGLKKETSIALYLVDNEKPLQMVGNSMILGDVYIPKKGIKKGYITSNAFSSRTFLEGNKFTASNQLPNIENVYRTPMEFENDTLLMEDVTDREILYHSFIDKTQLIGVKTSSFNNKEIIGNIIIWSKDSLFIKKGNRLENVIIRAPIVIFEKGFKGTIQIEASEKVELQEEVVLEYPSGIFMNTSNAEDIKVILKEDSKFIGGIVVTGTGGLGKGSKLISIDKGAEVLGEIYTNGSTELKGKIMGSLYTDNFYLKTDASSYENYIDNGIIDQKAMPNYFLGLSFKAVDSEPNDTYGVIKQL
tara:strand:- start:179 stop:1309 length:1131 start_codon:yes stop_codon:yes gene_type:complete